jgi:hypothetical protein
VDGGNIEAAESRFCDHVAATNQPNTVYKHSKT